MCNAVQYVYIIRPWDDVRLAVVAVLLVLVHSLFFFISICIDLKTFAADANKNKKEKER